MSKITKTENRFLFLIIAVVALGGLYLNGAFKSNDAPTGMVSNADFEESIDSTLSDEDSFNIITGNAVAGADKKMDCINYLTTQLDLHLTPDQNAALKMAGSMGSGKKKGVECISSVECSQMPEGKVCRRGYDVKGNNKGNWVASKTKTCNLFVKEGGPCEGEMCETGTFCEKGHCKSLRREYSQPVSPTSLQKYRLPVKEAAEGIRCTSIVNPPNIVEALLVYPANIANNRGSATTMIWNRGDAEPKSRKDAFMKIDKELFWGDAISSKKKCGIVSNPVALGANKASFGGPSFRFNKFCNFYTNPPKNVLMGTGPDNCKFCVNKEGATNDCFA